MTNKNVVLDETVIPKAEVTPSVADVYSLAVVQSGTEHVIDSDTDQIYVEFAILDSAGIRVATYRLGFPTDASADDIKAELIQYLVNYQSEQDMKIVNVVQEEAQAATKEVTDSLQDLEISGTVKE